MDVLLREYKTDDIPQITFLFNEVILEGNSFLSETVLDVDQMTNRLKTQERGTYVLELIDESCQNKIVGCYMIRPNLKGRGSHIANSTYMISKEFRKKGLGFLLASDSLKKAKELGYIGLQFNSVVVKNEASVKLWKKLNFEIKTTIENGFRMNDGSYSDIFIMYKVL